MRSEVLAAVTMKITFFSDVTPYIWVDKYQSVREVAFAMISVIRSLLQVISSKNYSVNFEVLLVANMKINVLFYVTPCSLVHS